ncbi:MAG: FKBP-type peptidyl-prolyl cis-trans isomerase, partial [Verrucomicrobia bacterium]|nr:FKBP-type peptidyl-prolyl cis-trans isomerase [Verrucomicrobiota bacterium]
ICSNPGQPATFKVKEADIPGWREALPLMPVGSKWRLFIPSQLAYGERGVGRELGPNETIITELELVSVK